MNEDMLDTKHEEILNYLIGRELHTDYKIEAIRLPNTLIIKTDISRFRITLEFLLNELKNNDSYLKQDLVKQFPQYFV